MRKESNFNVTDRIVVKIGGSDKVFDIAKKNEKAISNIVLSNDIVKGDGEKEWDINGEKVILSVKKALRYRTAVARYRPSPGRGP